MKLQKDMHVHQVGVCGKKNDLANMMDLLIYSMEGISLYAQELRAKGQKIDPKVDLFIMESLFATITNANYYEVIIKRVKDALVIREELKKQLGAEINHPTATFTAATLDEMNSLAQKVDSFQ